LPTTISEEFSNAGSVKVEHHAAFLGTLLGLVGAIGLLFLLLSLAFMTRLVAVMIFRPQVQYADRRDQLGQIYASVYRYAVTAPITALFALSRYTMPADSGLSAAYQISIVMFVLSLVGLVMVAAVKHR